jgi:hypothetical protein
MLNQALTDVLVKVLTRYTLSGWSCGDHPALLPLLGPPLSASAMDERLWDWFLASPAPFWFLEMSWDLFTLAA